MEKLYTSKTFLKMAGEEDANCILLTLPLCIRPWPKATETIKRAGICQSLGTITFVLFTKRQSQKGEGAWLNAPSKYARGISIFEVIFRINCKI